MTVYLPVELNQIKAALQPSYGSRPDLLNDQAVYLFEEYNAESQELVNGIPLRDIIFQNIVSKVRKVVLHKEND